MIFWRTVYIIAPVLIFTTLTQAYPFIIQPPTNTTIPTPAILIPEPPPITPLTGTPIPPAPMEQANTATTTSTATTMAGGYGGYYSGYRREKGGIIPTPLPTAKKIVHATREDFNTGTTKDTEIWKNGIITLKRKNLLNNPSFETDNSIRPDNLDGLAEKWGIWNPSGGNYTTELDTSNSTSGSKSQRITFSSNSKKAIYLIQDLKNVECSIEYTFSADVKVDDPEQVEVEVVLSFWNDTKWLKSRKSSSTAATNFTRMSVTTAATTDTNRLKAIVVLKPKFVGAMGTLWVDSAQLERSKEPTEYTEVYETTSGEYISPPINLGRKTTPYKLEWTSSIKPEGNIKFQIRSANNLNKLNSSPWYGPTSTEDYYTYISEGVNLLLNPSLEEDSNNDEIPDYTRHMGWGINDRTFTEVTDAFEGSKAVKVEITDHTSGDARWEILYDGTVEADSDYLFSVWHKENGDIGKILMSVGIEKEDGSTVWGYAGKYVQSSASWKQDVILFHTPSDSVEKIWLKLVLNKEGWIISDAYTLKKINRSSEWKINPLHHKSRWIQYKAVFSTTDSSYSPSLHDVTLSYGASVPEIHWINVLDDSGKQKYAFMPGERANFKVELLDFKGIANIESVTISIFDPAGNLVLRDSMSPGDVLSEVERYYEYRYSLPMDAALVTWRAEITAINREGVRYTETNVLKVREPYTSPPQKMTVGALAADYGFWNYKNCNKTIEAYSKYDGLEIWKLGISWDLLEPEHSSFNEEYVDAILKFMDAAQSNGAKVQIGIAQQWWPTWVNNGDWDNKERYRYEVTERLADTWKRLAERVKDHPAFDSYLIINEENHVYDADSYLRGLNKITSSIRSVDGNLNHRITVRPTTKDSYIRSRIAQDGNQDYEYGTGVYPTSWAWYLKSYEDPVSNTSYLRMSRLRASPLAYGGPGGVGEIGFFKASDDSFGDEEKLLAFERAMSIAYDQGMDEFMLWGGSFSFKNPEIYFPKLKRFRDNLTMQPRSDHFDLRILIDNNEWLYVESNPPSSKLDMEMQPYLNLIKTLDENGYTWFYTHPNAEGFQSISFNATIKLSEIKGKDESEQNRIISERVGNITPSGGYYPWPTNE